MKTAFTTNGDNIDAGIEPAFGRCRNFLIVDSDSGRTVVVPNPGAARAGGAGVKAAETLAGLGIDTLITGSLGSNAGPLLRAAGISVLTGQSGSIRAHLPPLRGELEKEPLGPASGGPNSVKPQPAVSRRNPAGFCFCVHCDYRADDDTGLPCFKFKCPRCGCTMERRFE